MKAIYVICSIMFILGSLGCKQDSTVNEATQEPALSNQSPETTDQVAQQRDVSGGHDYNFLTDKILIYNTVFGGESGANMPQTNDWIHLLKSGLYLAGRSKDQTHTGKWSYEPKAQILFLRPDTKDFKMSEWTVKATNDYIILVGTQSYGNQSTQIQLIRSEVLPQ